MAYVRCQHSYPNRRTFRSSTSSSLCNWLFTTTHELVAASSRLPEKLAITVLITHHDPGIRTALPLSPGPLVFALANVQDSMVDVLIMPESFPH